MNPAKVVLIVASGVLALANGLWSLFQKKKDGKK